MAENTTLPQQELAQRLRKLAKHLDSEGAATLSELEDIEAAADLIWKPEKTPAPAPLLDRR